MAKISNKVSVDHITALRIAIAAYRYFDNKIVRSTAENKIGNKELIHQYFVSNVKFAGCDDESITTDAESMSIHLQQRITINALTGKPTSAFLTNIAGLLVKDSISERDFGLLAWAPKMAADLARADELNEELVRVGHSSNFIGKEGGKVSIKFNLLNCRYLPHYNCFSHIGSDEHGNMVSFFNKSKIENGTIVGRIKNHGINRYCGNAKTTYLNYVKLAK